jgi:hypothetical protein
MTTAGMIISHFFEGDMRLRVLQGGELFPHSGILK